MTIHLHGDAAEGVRAVEDSTVVTIGDLFVDPDDLIWVIDEEDPLDPGILIVDLVAARKIELVKHRCKKINVSVSYNGIEAIIRVAPSRKLRAVIRQSIKIAEFQIDPGSAADLELRLPGSEEGLDSSLPVGRLVANGKCEIELILAPAVRHAG